MKKLLVLMILFCPQVFAVACPDFQVSKAQIVPEVASNTGQVCIYFPDNGRNPAEFLIRDPENNSFFIVTEGNSVAPQFHNIAQQNTLAINLANLKGWHWKEGKKTLEKVFNLPGNYQLYFADNLETEYENTDAIALNLTVSDNDYSGEWQIQIPENQHEKYDFSAIKVAEGYQLVSPEKGGKDKFKLNGRFISCQNNVFFNYKFKYIFSAGQYIHTSVKILKQNQNELMVIPLMIKGIEPSRLEACDSLAKLKLAKELKFRVVRKTT